MLGKHPYIIMVGTLTDMAIRRYDDTYSWSLARPCAMA